MADGSQIRSAPGANLATSAATLTAARAAPNPARDELLAAINAAYPEPVAFPPNPLATYTPGYFGGFKNAEDERDFAEIERRYDAFDRAWEAEHGAADAFATRGR